MSRIILAYAWHPLVIQGEIRPGKKPPLGGPPPKKKVGDGQLFQTCFLFSSFGKFRDI